MPEAYEGSRFNDMSKTFETNAQKALTMVSGIKADGLDALEAEAKKAIEMIQEVDRLRQTVSEKLQAANEKLADVKERAMAYRQSIMNNFPMEK